MKKATGEIIFYSIIGIMFYLLISQYIQVHEDLSYCFNIKDKSFITSFSDALSSQAYCYINGTARFWVHTFVQYFCSLTDKTVFFVLSSVLFVLLNICLLYIVRQEFGRRLSDKYIIIGWLFLMIPLVGTSYLGHIAFVVNYLWASSINAFFIALLTWKRKNNYSNNNVFHILFLSVIAIFVGGFQESFSICIGGTLFIYMTINWKTLHKSEKLIIIAYIIGAMTIIFAPGNIKRFLSSGNIEDGSIIIKLLTNLGRVLLGYWQILIFIIISLLFFILRRNKTINFFKKNWTYFTAIIIFLTFTTFIAYTARHQLTCLSLILLIILLKALYSWKYFNDVRIEQITIYFIVMIVLFSYYKVYNYREELKTVYLKFEYSAKNMNDSIMIAGDFIRFDKELFHNNIFREFTNITHACSQIYFKDGLTDYSNYITKKKNNKSKTAVLPYNIEHIIQLTEDKKEISKNVYALNKYSFIIKRNLTDAENNPNQYIIIEEEATSLKGKIFSIFKKSKINKRKLKFNEIDMKFIYGNNIYYYIVADRTNIGYKINKLTIQCLQL